MFTLKDLPYEYDALEPFIDKQTMTIHHDKHHAAYVQNLNDALKSYPDFEGKEITAILADLDKIPQEIRGKVINHGGGHANHGMFWEIMAPVDNGGGVFSKGKLNGEITKEFGSFEKFKDLFKQTALGRFGSGWAWLVSDKGKLSVIDTQNQDTPISQGLSPILALDVWEHAYYLKYQNRRMDYIDAWWNVVNWTKAEELYLKTI